MVSDEPRSVAPSANLDWRRNLKLTTHRRSGSPHPLHPGYLLGRSLFPFASLALILGTLWWGPWVTLVLAVLWWRAVTQVLG